MYTTDDMEKTEYQFNRNDPEAIILREFIAKSGEIVHNFSNNEEMYNKQMSLLKEEITQKLGVGLEELYHKLNIYICHCEDDERAWREQKYGK